MKVDDGAKIDESLGSSSRMTRGGDTALLMGCSIMFFRLAIHEEADGHADHDPEHESDEISQRVGKVVAFDEGAERQTEHDAEDQSHAELGGFCW